MNQGKKYDNIAEGFAKMRDSFATEKKYLDFLIQHLKPGSHLLDIGCGSGYPIATYFIEKGFQLTGIDGSEKLLEKAKITCPTMQCILGDVRTVPITEQYDAIVEWWCLFHIPKVDHAKMIERFAAWLKPEGILEFTSGDSEFETTDSNMLDQSLDFYSLDPKEYEKYLHQNGFKILLKEYDQPQHLVWVAKKV